MLRIDRAPPPRARRGDPELERSSASSSRSPPRGCSAEHSVGRETAAKLLTLAGDNPERLRSDSALAALCGASPVEASSGQTTRHRLNRGGDRQANNALYTIAMVRMLHHPETKAYVARRTPRARPAARSAAASCATSPAASTPC